jgi:DNA-binding transcriptional LysR family regulator
MTLQQLYYAITITDTGSFSKASEILYISQPSLTAAIQELEKEMEIVIFNRTHKGVSLTNDGAEFLLHARQLYQQYEMLLDKYQKGQLIKKKFGVSSQHYSFAVKSFVELVHDLDASEYELAFRETKTREVIEDVCSQKSELGILYLSDFNRKILTKIFRANELEFHKLIDCKTYVYLWKGHPLSQFSSLRLDQLTEYPCLSFEQGDSGSFYFAEEIFSTNSSPKAIKVNDRATMLNLMVGLNGYTLCSGIICNELNGDGYLAIPLVEDGDSSANNMEIGYILKKNLRLSSIGKKYIEKMSGYLSSLPSPS